MFNPSAAPRWKIATRILRRPRVVAAARPSQKGTDPAPAMTIADPRRKIRLVSIPLPPLKFGRADYQARDQSGSRLPALQSLFNRLHCLFGWVAVEQQAS